MRAGKQQKVENNTSVTNEKRSYTPINLRTKNQWLTGNLILYSAKFFVLKINESISLKEIDRRAFLSFELPLKEYLKICIRGKVKESFGQNFFFFEIREIDYFQNDSFIGSSHIINPIVSLYSNSNNIYTGLLEEISEYEMALSIKLTPRGLSPGTNL